MKRIITTIFSTLLIIQYGNSQENRNLQYFREAGQNGINQFETLKDSMEIPFTGIKVLVGGDFTIQFQCITHQTGSNDTLVKLGNNFNLPTANLNLDVQLDDGVRMNLVTYLSSRHHNETWVKGGYIQFDKLNFIKENFLEKFMNFTTIKIGMSEINYGDVHFRRSDNARTIYNPFVGNYIMDAFTTEMFGEINLQKYGIIVVAGMSNGNLNQTVVKGTKEPKPSFYGKFGYDKQLTQDFRLRLTGSMYLSPGYDNGQYLYSGDRTGSRYYNVMQSINSTDNFRSGSFSPNFVKYQSYQINPFIKYKGCEFFGIFELVNGDKSRSETGGSYKQIGAELIYRFGAKNQFYIGGRYNLVYGKDNTNASIKSIDRINAGGGLFLTKNILLKAEYVNQNYTGNGWSGTIFYGGNFNGVMVEAVIGF